MKTFALLSLCVLVPTLSHAFDSKAYCRQMGDAVGGSAVVELACREQEQRAISQLTRLQLSDRVRQYCTEMGQAVGGSYVVFLACAEQELAAQAQLQ